LPTHFSAQIVVARGKFIEQFFEEYPATANGAGTINADELLERSVFAVASTAIGCRFRKLHPIDSRVMANRNMITG
jgi:hypothetical protein